MQQKCGCLQGKSGGNRRNRAPVLETVSSKLLTCWISPVKGVPSASARPALLWGMAVGVSGDASPLPGRTPVRPHRVLAHMVVKLMLLGSRPFVVTTSPSAPLILRLGFVLRPEACTVTFAGKRHLRMLEQIWTFLLYFHSWSRSYFTGPSMDLTLGRHHTSAIRWATPAWNASAERLEQGWLKQ